jgi:hypothetical protein
MNEAQSSELPRADAYMKSYICYNWLVFVDTNLTEQELIDSWQFTQEEIEAMLAWERFEIHGK